MTCRITGKATTRHNCGKDLQTAYIFFIHLLAPCSLIMSSTVARAHSESKTTRSGVLDVKHTKGAIKAEC